MKDLASIPAVQSCCRDCPCNPENHAVVAREPIFDAEVAIVIDQPSAAEIKNDKFLAGGRSSHGAFLRAAFESVGVDCDDLYLCNATNCKPNIKKGAMLKKAMLGCRARLIDELRESGVEKVLCVGPVGYSQLMSLTKVAPITGVRGRWQEAYGMQIMATLPPGFVYGQPDYFRDFAADVEKFFTSEGPEPFPDITMIVPESMKELDDAFAQLAEFPDISCDLETTGFSPIDESIICAGFAGVHENGDGLAVVLSEDMLSRKGTWTRIGAQLGSKQGTIFHNGKFDLQHIKQNLLDHKLKYTPRNVQDTLILHYLSDERPIGRFKSHGLETISRLRYDAPDYGIPIKEFLRRWADADDAMREQLRAELHLYNALDCYYTARLFPDLWNELIDSEDDLNEYWENLDWDGPVWTLLDCYENLLMPAVLALADIEHHGILLDVDMYRETKVRLEIEIAKLEKKIRRKTKDPNFNAGSWQQVKAYIYNKPDDPTYPGLGLPYGLDVDAEGNVYHTARRGGLKEGPTAAPVLKALAYRFPEHTPIIDMICEYRNLKKNAGTYVNGLLTRMDSDNRIRSSFNPAGTSTGRLSSSNPNLQNVPDASHTGIEIRAGFMAPPGHKLIEADYKQLEVRIAAWLSDDPVMKEIFVSGRDCHQEIAFSIFKKPKGEISHYMRWLAKNILFGLLYGRGYESVATGPEQEDIARYGGERWSIEQVKEFFENLLAAWKDYAAWQQNQRQIGYKQHGVMMPTGRRRRFDFIPQHDAGYVGRASFNNPVQGVASDFTLNALIQLHARLPKPAHIISTVHDCIIVECPDELVEEVTALMHQIMEQEPLFEIGLPLQIDLEIGDRWGMKEELAHEMIEVE